MRLKSFVKLFININLATNPKHNTLKPFEWKSYNIH